MKKLLSLVLVLVMLSLTLLGCQAPGGLPTNMNGTDAAKLLLANGRLDASLFRGGDNLFDSGAAAFEQLSAIADRNLTEVSYADTLSVETAAPFQYSDERRGDGEYGTPPAGDARYPTSDGSVVEIRGNTFYWSNFAEYSNSYDYFSNITGNVKSSAELGAQLIDDIKQFVRVIDRWVDIGGNRYYLHVEEDTEIIYNTTHDGQKSLCMRTKRADGTNVYELWTAPISGGSSRMIYIPGEKYEYSYILDGFNHNFLAENTKGFWEVVDVGKTDWGYNVSCMVLKDDVCYDTFYSAEQQTVAGLRILSSDRKTDILLITDHGDSASVELYLQAFDGVSHLELTVDPDKVGPIGTEGVEVYYSYDMGHWTYFAYGSVNPTVVLKKNALTLEMGKKFLDGKIRIDSVYVSHSNKENRLDGYVPSVSIHIEGATYDERMDTLNEFLELVGLSCRRDFSTVESGILRAYEELAQMVKYHEWNESPIRTYETLDRGWDNNLEKHAAYAAMLDAIRNAEVVSLNDIAAWELNISFAPITAKTLTSATNNALAVTVQDLALTVEDTTLFVVGGEYTLGFALAREGAGANLVHLPAENRARVTYQGGESFTVTTGATLTLPALGAGEYTLVAYIATAEEGIRTSAYIPIVGAVVSPYQTKSGAHSLTVLPGADGTLVLSSVPEPDIQVTLPAPEGGTYRYASLYEAFATAAYEYGFVREGAVLELQSGEEWISLADSEEPLGAGTYRLAYSIENGSYTVEGYLYTVLTPSEE